MFLQPDQIVGEYKIVRPLGRGGLGAVYEATHLISQRAEALKVLLAEQTGAPGMEDRFRREIQLLASLSHPNISGLHNAFHHQGQLIMVMELVEGEDLRTLSRRTRLPLPHLMNYTDQVLAGLEYAHTRGVVHRDIKPANIMVTPSGLVKLLDFGIAITDRSLDLTVAGALIGSPSHISPEQIRGEKATPQSDIYSLGVTLYEVIAGQPPIRGDSTYDLLNAHMNMIPAPLHAVRADVPPALSEAIATALEKDPGKRFSGATEFGTALRACLMCDGSDITTSQPMQRPSTNELQRPTVMMGPSIEALTRHLATFVGPIAKVVAGRISKQAVSLDEMYAKAAKQIDNEDDRQKFLRTRPR